MAQLTLRFPQARSSRPGGEPNARALQHDQASSEPYGPDPLKERRSIV
jgi:hypothetical protein